MINKLDCNISSKNGGGLSIDCFIKKRLSVLFITLLIIVIVIIFYYLYKKITERKIVYSSNSSPIPKPTLPSDLSNISFLKNPLTDDDIKSLTTEQILSLTPQQLKLLSPDHFALFNSKSIRGIDVRKDAVKMDILCSNEDKKNTNIALITKCLNYLTSNIPELQ